ncbi:MAG TPA: sterol desaturase family protein, partial [Arenimonas sp.]|nr:sterol desaturase family protein [Arenimonas sp.]
MATPSRSWTAHIAALLGLSSLLGVLCFHFPELLTSREFRQIYTEGFARGLLLVGLVAAFALGTLAVLRGWDRRVALVGVGAATLAVLGGGVRVPFDAISDSPWSLGLDWFVVSLFFSALVFVPIERLLGRVSMSPLRPEWRTDLAYFFIGHVGIQFILLAVTAWTTGVASLVAFPRIGDAIQALPVWAQFLMAVFCADLAQALLHRAYHRWGPLWRFHAIHHSSRHLDWLAGSRMHLVEI